MHVFVLSCIRKHKNMHALVYFLHLVPPFTPIHHHNGKGSIGIASLVANTKQHVHSSLKKAMLTSYCFALFAECMKHNVVLLCFLLQVSVNELYNFLLEVLSSESGTYVAVIP